MEGNGEHLPVVLATEAAPPEIALLYPTVAQAFARLSPVLLAVFAMAFAWTIMTSRQADPRFEPAPLALAARSSAVWGLFAAWILLAANNIWQLPWQLGYDWKGHLEYIEYIARHRSLPLANQGWQMFQPPLFYLLEAPWYALLSSHWGDEVIVRVLRFVPLLCGLVQIEIVYRVARAVFPEKEDLQAIATVVGGLMPMQISISQFIGNEPLAGCFTASWCSSAFCF